MCSHANKGRDTTREINVKFCIISLVHKRTKVILMDAVQNITEQERI